MSKRNLLCASLLSVSFAVGGGAHAASGHHSPVCDILLYNGKIHTMDENRSVVSAVLIENGRFAAVGWKALRYRPYPRHCRRHINLRRRTVIPGLIDNHVHILLAGIRPGHETREMETAFSIKQAQKVIRRKARTVPKGELISSIGGIVGRQFLPEGRLPNLAELDKAAPRHPVYLHAAFAGPCTTNTLGKQFLESQGVSVDDQGSIVGSCFSSFIAFDSIWGKQPDAAKGLALRKQTTQDVIAYFNSVGITTAHSVGGSQLAGPGFFNPDEDYNVIFSLAEEGKVNIRLRLYFNALTEADGEPPLRAALDRIEDDVNFPEFGDLIKKMGQGEHLVSLARETDVPQMQISFDNALELAKFGGQNMQHIFADPTITAHVEVWEATNDLVPIAPLRWSADHVVAVELETLDRLMALGAGVRAHGAFRYQSGSPTNNGPEYRKLLAHGIRVGTGSDAAQAAPINPWLNVYYMVTGKDNTGTLINDGQQISREKAVWLYTAANGWFSFEEDKLGSIEVGKLADLAVLNKDVFDPRKVSDEEIKRISSVLTIVGGRVVHDRLHRGHGNPGKRRQGGFR